VGGLCKSAIMASYYFENLIAEKQESARALALAKIKQPGFSILFNLYAEPLITITNYIYVDDGASGIEDGTPAHPYNTIQEGIDAATSGDTVLLR